MALAGTAVVFSDNFFEIRGQDHYRQVSEGAGFDSAQLEPYRGLGRQMVMTFQK